MVHAAKKGINLDTAKDISLKARGKSLFSQPLEIGSEAVHQSEAREEHEATVNVIFRGESVLLSLLSPLLSLNLALKLTDIQLDTSFFSTLNENHMLTGGPGITGIL